MNAEAQLASQLAAIPRDELIAAIPVVVLPLLREHPDLVVPDTVSSAIAAMAAIAGVNSAAEATPLVAFFNAVGTGSDVGKAFEAAQRAGIGDELTRLLTLEQQIGLPSSNTAANAILGALDAALAASAQAFDLSRYSAVSSRDLNGDVTRILKDISAHTGKTVAIAKKPDRMARGGPAPSLDYTQTPSNLSSAGTYFIEANNQKVGEVTLFMGQQSHLTAATPRDIAKAIFDLVSA